MKHTLLRYGSLCLLASAATAAGCATSDDASSADDPANEEMTEAALSSNEHTAFNFFVSKGLTQKQAAGIVGNLMQESNVIPTSKQFGGGPGRGIAQWSVGGRWDTSKGDNVKTYASQHGGESMTALNTQLNFIWFELTTFSGYGLAQLRASTSVSAAVTAFQDKYEICGTCDSSNRLKFANEVLAQFGTGAATGAACFSNTLGKEMPENSCVQSKSDKLWYQCSNGAWVDRFTDPDACKGVFPL
jgi:hypothetical protein